MVQYLPSPMVFVKQIFQAHEAQQLLRSGTQDLPRMTKVLENERVDQFPLVYLISAHANPKVFLLVNEDTIKRYKNDLADEVEPTINELIGRAEQGLAALEKKEVSLKTKVIFQLVIRSRTTDDGLTVPVGGCSSAS